VDDQLLHQRDGIGRLAAAARAEKNKADGESDVLAKIAEMPESDRVMAERLHVSFALEELAAADEARIAALVKKAVS